MTDNSNGTIFRIEKTKDFTVMSNHHLRNINLSLKAKGLLSLMLSLPEKWDYSMKGLVAICNDGDSSVRSGIQELEKAGYIDRERERKTNGQLGRVNFIVREVPTQENVENKAFAPHSENPHVDNPPLGNPHVDNQPQSSTYQSNTYELSTNQSFSQMIDASVFMTDGLIDLKKVISFFDKRLNYNGVNKTKYSFTEKEYIAYRNIIAEVFCKNDDDLVKINGKNIEVVNVKTKFMLIGLDTIDYVHKQIQTASRGNKIKNIVAYVITSLYRAPLDVDAGLNLTFDKNFIRKSSYDLDTFNEIISSQSIWD